MEECQKKNREKFRDLVTKLNNSPVFAKFVKKQNLADLRFEVLSKPHLSQALTLFCFQFSMYGGAINCLCFNMSVEDNLSQLKEALEFAIKMGTSWVVLQRKTNQVVGICIVRDYIEHEQANAYLSDAPTDNFKDLQRQLKISTSAELKRLVLRHYPRSPSTIKYGEIQYHERLATHPSLGGKKIASMLVVLLALSSYALGYSMSYGNTIHPATTKIFSSYTAKTFEQIMFDYSKFKFAEEGKFKTMEDVYSHLKTEYGYTDEYVDHLRQNSKMAFHCTSFVGPQWWMGYASKFPDFKDLVIEFFPQFSKI